MSGAVGSSTSSQLATDAPAAAAAAELSPHPSSSGDVMVAWSLESDSDALDTNLRRQS